VAVAGELRGRRARSAAAFGYAARRGFIASAHCSTSAVRTRAANPTVENFLHDAKRFRH
jgi:hypothetical protein